MRPLPMAQVAAILQNSTAAWKFSPWSRQPEAFRGRMDTCSFELQRNIT